MPRSTGADRTDGGLSQIVPPGGGEYIDVLTEARLGLVNNTTLVGGEVAWVRSYQDWWTLYQSSAALVPNQIINALVNSGTGWRWHRSNVPHAFWAEQATYHVNETLGNDENLGFTTGTGNALRTFDEYNRRVGGKPYANQNIIFDTDYTVGPIAVQNYREQFFTATVTVEGTETILLNNVVATTVTPTDATNATPIQTRILASGLAVSWTASGLIGKTGIVLTGASAGSFFQVQTDLGAKVARCTQCVSSTGVITEMANGDTFKIVEYTRHNSYSVECAGTGPIVIQKLRLTGTALDLTGAYWSFYACDITGPTIYNEGPSGFTRRFFGCRVSGGSATYNAFSGSIALFTCCNFPSGVTIGTSTSPSDPQCGMVNYNGCTFGLPMSVTGNVRVAFTDVNNVAPNAGGSFFGVGSPIQFQKGAFLDCSDAIPFGTGVTGIGITLSQSMALYATSIQGGASPNLVGASIELRLDGADLVNSAVITNGSVRCGGSIAMTYSGVAFPGIDLGQVSAAAANRSAG